MIDRIEVIRGVYRDDPPFSAFALGAEEPRGPYNALAEQRIVRPVLAYASAATAEAAIAAVQAKAQAEGAR